MTRCNPLETIATRQLRLRLQHRGASITWILFVCLGLTLVTSKIAAVTDETDASSRRPADRPTLKQLQANLRSPSVKIRASAIQMLADRADRESTRLIMQQGLRDRMNEIAQASMQAIDDLGRAFSIETHRDWFAAEVVEPLAAEFQGKRRRNGDFVARAARTAARVPTTPVYEQLFALLDKGSAEDQTLLLAGLLLGIDDLAARQDVRLLDILPMVESSRSFTNVFGLRRAAYHAAARVPRAETVAFLIRHLGEEQGELRGAIAQGLRRLTRHDQGIDAVAWNRWWTEHAPGFRFEETIPEPSRYAGSAPTYYGLPVHANRLAFVLDTSGSMATGAREPRIEVAKRELIRAIEQLPETTLFNIVVYNSHITPWHESLAPASARWKAEAIAFVSAQQPTGKTSTYDAISIAMQLRSDLEAIYLLSDGAPSSGSLVQPDRILEAVSRMNRVRRLTINAIGLFGGAADEVRGLEQFMQQLAANNYGEYRRID